jgi:hypothetical protein
MTKQTGNRRANIPAQFDQGFLDQLDSRTNLAKNLRGKYTEICSDLGGKDSLSYMQRSLIERALWFEFWIASQERALADGGELDVGRWTQAVNSLQGIYSRLGLQRQAKPAPDLRSYIANKS